MAEERLHKFLARAGVASRRSSEDLIRGGHVAVDGQIVTEMGHRIDPATARVTVDGRLVQNVTQLVYLALNKPRDYVTTAGDDPLGRPTVMSLVRRRERLFPVGRLDAATEGLLLLTNDGELAHRMMHPRYYVQKEYIAKVRGVPGPEALRLLREGLPTPHQPTPARPHRVELIERLEGDASLVRVVIHEGAKHQVRDMLEAVGHPALTLRRTRIGPIFLGELRRSETRELTTDEVATLRAMVRLPAEAGETAPRLRLRDPMAGKAADRPERGRAVGPRPAPAWRRDDMGRDAGPPAGSRPEPRPVSAGRRPYAPPPAGGAPTGPRPPRRAWWADDLDEHPPRVRTWHATGARAAEPPPDPSPSPRRPEPDDHRAGAPRGPRPDFPRPVAGGRPPRPDWQAGGPPPGPGRSPGRPSHAPDDRAPRRPGPSRDAPPWRGPTTAGPRHTGGPGRPGGRPGGERDRGSAGGFDRRPGPGRPPVGSDRPAARDGRPPYRDERPPLRDNRSPLRGDSPPRAGMGRPAQPAGPSRPGGEAPRPRDDRSREPWPHDARPRQGHSDDRGRPSRPPVARPGDARGRDDRPRDRPPGPPPWAAGPVRSAGPPVARRDTEAAPRPPTRPPTPERGPERPPPALPREREPGGDGRPPAPPTDAGSPAASRPRRASRPRDPNWQPIWRRKEQPE